MGRPLLIVVLVVLMTMSGIATASPGDRVRLPVDLGGVDGHDTFVIVERGDHLWKISASHLGETTAAEVGPYWRQVVAVNEPTLRSGDPDLIYPGERIEMPALDDRP